MKRFAPMPVGIALAVALTGGVHAQDDVAKDLQQTDAINGSLTGLAVTRGPEYNRVQLYSGIFVTLEACKIAISGRVKRFSYSKDEADFMHNPNSLGNVQELSARCDSAYTGETLSEGACPTGDKGEEDCTGHFIWRRPALATLEHK